MWEIKILKEKGIITSSNLFETKQEALSHWQKTEDFKAKDFKEVKFVEVKWSVSLVMSKSPHSDGVFHTFPWLDNQNVPRLFETYDAGKTAYYESDEFKSSGIDRFVDCVRVPI